MKLFWSVRQLQIIFDIVVFFYHMSRIQPSTPIEWEILSQSKLLNPYALIDKPLDHLLGLSML